MHEIMHFIGVCPDNMAHLDILDLIQWATLIGFSLIGAVRFWFALIHHYLKGRI